MNAGDTTGEITHLLAAWRSGDGSAQERLIPLVYDELRRRAHAQLRRSLGSPVFSTTELVHEAYLRLVSPGDPAWQSRDHFFAVAAKAMRSIVVDFARRAHALKRGAGARPITLEHAQIHVTEQAAELLDLDTALEQLAGLEPRLATIVELRFFGGLSVEEVAKLQGVTDRTIKRDWRKARTLLYQFLNPE
ncbi:MAG: sigma-70 family RNA polymerase sigma factor [Thermoanaerobaculia bacterium]|nr:sigma-70 family RNA polymerase sigma factor [Thermoanaerobaculia bacterium]